jgi:hypothetical protein
MIEWVELYVAFARAVVWAMCVLFAVIVLSHEMSYASGRWKAALLFGLGLVMVGVPLIFRDEPLLNQIGVALCWTGFAINKAWPLVFHLIKLKVWGRVKWHSSEKASK